MYAPVVKIYMIHDSCRISNFEIKEMTYLIIYVLYEFTQRIFSWRHLQLSVLTNVLVGSEVH